MDRSAAHRALLWYRKMDGNVYKMILDRVKDHAFERFLDYQAFHEWIIKMVRETLMKYDPSGNEVYDHARLQAYVWYAQGLWYLTQKYKGEALRKEANALFMYWLMLGLREEPLREIAYRLGIKIDDWDNLLDPIAMPISQIVTQSIDRLLTERRVYDILERTERIPAYIEPITGYVDVKEVVEYILIDTYSILKEAVIHILEGFIDATKSNVDLQFIMYVKVHPEADYIPYYAITLTVDDLKNAVYVAPRISYAGLKLAVKPVSTPSESFRIYYTFFIERLYE